MEICLKISIQPFLYSLLLYPIETDEYNE